MNKGGNNMTTDSVLQGCDRCPNCHQVPSLTFDEHFKSYSITCPNHGYEMMGPTVQRAILYWNRVIGFIRRDAYKNIAEAGHCKPDESFCIHCEDYTGTRVTATPKLYKAECKGCGLLKFEKAA